MERKQRHSTLSGVKWFIYFYLFYCLVVVLPAQSYIITEQELQILEMQYQKDKEYKQKVQYLEQELKAELSTLKTQLTESKQESMNLNQLLHQERLTTQKLTTYSAELEQEQRKNQLLFKEKEQEIFRLKNKIKNCVIVIFSLSIVIIFSVLLLILFLKLKK